MKKDDDYFRSQYIEDDRLVAPWFTTDRGTSDLD
jgi:hypothetical protein